ncbi:MAG TPA: DUF935 family protein [Chthoniobacterales bacterium]|nr:DUF935 family protein [Chthoniobacterales bacterium]
MISTFRLDQVNPLRGLDEAGLIALQEQGMRGYYSRLMWTYFFFEKKDPIIRAVKRLLLASLAGLDWSIKQADTGEDAEKKALAEKQADALRKEYDAISNLRAALTFLALADLRGFSHCNKVYAGAINRRTGRPFNEDLDPWTVTELRIVEQWFWAKNGFYGPWLYNKEARETNTGPAIDVKNYVIHQVDDPADEIFAQMGVKRRVNDADWDGFLEDYGVPPQFFAMPPNVPRDKEAEYQRLAELALSRSRGAVPYQTELLTPSATGSGGVGIFKERLEYIDEQIVIAGTSGQLTILAESGSGTLAGGAQKEVFDGIAQAIANQLATVFHKQFDEPVLERLFPDQPVLAYFEFAKVDKEETKEVLGDAKTAAEAGYMMDEEELSERAGMKLTFVGKPGANGTAAPSVDGEPVKPPVENSDQQPAASPQLASVADSLHLTTQFVAPARTVIDELLALAQSGDVTDAQLLASAEEVLKRIPELAESTDVSEIAEALEKAMALAAEKTLAGKV